MAETPFTPTGTVELNTQLTFAGSEPRPLPGKPLTAQAVPVQGGQQGSARGNPSAQFLGAAPVGIQTTMGGFLDIAEKLVGPKLQEMRQAAMYEGMQAYVAGQKIEDMRKEQNPIARAFGADGAFVQGAVIHQSASAVSGLGKYLNDNMEALAELDPRAFGEHLRQVTANAYEELDPAARGMAAAQFIELHTQAMATHVAAHERFRKEQAFKTTVESVAAAGGMRQSMVGAIAAGTVNSSDVEAADQRIIELLDSKPATTSTKEWQTVTIRSAQTMLENGNFQGFEVLKRSESWRGLQPEQRDALVRAAEGAWQREELKNPAYLMDVIGRTNVLATLQQGTSNFDSPDSLIQWMHEQNNLNDAQTGQPAFNNREMAQYVDAWYAGMARAANAAAKVDDEALADNLFLRFVNTTGDADVSALSADQMKERAIRMWDQIGTTADDETRNVLMDKFVGAMAADARAVPPVLKQQLGRDLAALRNGDAPTARTLQSLALAQEVMARPNGVEAMTAIVGGENALSYKALLDIGIDFTNKDQVSTYTRSMRAAAAVTPTADEVARMDKAIGSARSWLPWKDGHFRPDDLTDPGAAVLRSVAAPLAARYRKQFPGLTEEEVVTAALADARRGGDVVAGMFVRPNPTSAGLTTPRQTLAERLGREPAPKLYAEATLNASRAAAAAQAAARGMENFDPTGYRAVDSFNLGGGAVQLTLRTFDRWGFDAPDIGDIKITLTADQIDRAYLEAEANAVRENAGRKLIPDIPLMPDLPELPFSNVLRNPLR